MMFERKWIVYVVSVWVGVMFTGVKTARAQKGVPVGVQDKASDGAARRPAAQTAANGRPLRAKRRTPAGRPSRRQQLNRIWARFRWEPAIAVVQKAAVRHASLKRSSVQSWLRRVRHAAWLPDVRIGLERNHGAQTRLKAEPGTESQWVEEKDGDLSYDIQVRWSFDRLIFDPNELKVSREAQRVMELREEVLHQVTRIYFERRRLQILAVIKKKKSLRAAALHRLAVGRLTGALDALTGGWFSREIKRRRQKRATRRSRSST